MLTLGVRCLLVLGVGLWTATASAQTKMTIATGVDPVFSAYYVAQQEGLFKKHGLDVRINTGPSGSAMVAFLVNGQIESAFGSEIAGVANHNLDPNVVVVAQATRLVRWIAVVGRNIDTLDGLKGKKVGIARGSGGEVFLLAMIDKLKLNPSDYTIVNVEAPEMVAALERGNIDAYAVWEPWVTRGLAAVKTTKVLKNLDPPLVENLMTKLRFEMVFDDFTLNLFRLAESQLKQQGKLTKPLDYNAFFYPDLMRTLLPAKVNYSLGR